jgi:hypothetical protein
MSTIGIWEGQVFPLWRSPLKKEKSKEKNVQKGLDNNGNIEGICIFSDCDSNTYTREWAVEMGTDIPPVSPPTGRYVHYDLPALLVGKQSNQIPLEVKS